MLYGATIGLGAFLLFQLQPIVARSILSWFGGSAAVWSTCLLFFQAALLLGYFYADWSNRRLRPAVQSWIHTAILTVSLLFLPIIPSARWKPYGSSDPSLRILMLLAAVIGLPYVLLSTTGPLLQKWYSRSNRLTPYRFYALSNAGSLLALLTYPIVVEPFLSSRHQAFVWSAAYVLYAALCAVTALGRRHDADGRATAESLENVAALGWKQYGHWVALAACPSVLLLSITSHLSQNVAPVPFLWILPLSLYLLSFVVCFGDDRWYRRAVWLPLVSIAVGTMAYALFQSFTEFSLGTTVAGFALGLFACCMFCHGELAHSKPPPSHLTSFYLASALGGAVGGVFVALVAPHIFIWYDELPLTLIMTAVLALLVMRHDPSSRLQRPRWRLLWLPLYGLAVFLAAYVGLGLREQSAHVRFAGRNFYGRVKVQDDTTDDGDAVRELVHGTTNHGAQILDPSRRCQPTTYYGTESGIGLVFKQLVLPEPLRIGVMGLGAGTLAGFARPGDYYRFYEINPLVIEAAKTEFTFVTGCGGTVDIVPGDARLSLEREASQQFDVLVMDAFSSDSIPIHLITKEALAVDFRHLKPKGVLAINISNRYLDLRPVFGKLADAFDKEALVVSQETDDNLIYASTWVLVSARGGLLDAPGLRSAGAELKPPADNAYLWTDDYSSLWKVLTATGAGPH